MAGVHTVSPVGPQNSIIDLSGEVCPTALLSDPSILFVIDVSSSMEDNDPMVRDSCGRYDAVKAIMAKTKSLLANNAAGRAGVVFFARGIDARSITFRSFSEFNAIASPETICLYSRWTNFEAAFTTAKQWLDNESSLERVVYFITDGEPTRTITFANDEISDREIERISVSAS